MNALPCKRLMRHNMKRNKNKLHKLGVYNGCKISLSRFDDKYYNLHDGINSIAYLHKVLNQ